MGRERTARRGRPSARDRIAQLRQLEPPRRGCRGDRSAGAPDRRRGRDRRRVARRRRGRRGDVRRVCAGTAGAGGVQLVSRPRRARRRRASVGLRGRRLQAAAGAAPRPALCGVVRQLRPARLDRLPEQYFAALLTRVAAAAARAGEPPADLGRGNPDIPPPRHVVEALGASAGRGDTHGYAPFAGLPALKEAIAERYRSVYGIDVDPATEVAVLPGSKTGLMEFAQVCVERGDTIVLPDPVTPTTAPPSRSWTRATSRCPSVRMRGPTGTRRRPRLRRST